METERKLKSLEVDLAKAEEARKERQNALRYHKVRCIRTYVSLCSLETFTRLNSSVIDCLPPLNNYLSFIERQKICRKIKQLKKQLEDPETPTETIRESLLERRIDLNYILVWNLLQNDPTVSEKYPKALSQNTKVHLFTSTEVFRSTSRNNIKN